MYPYALIGNCHTSALINATGSVEWMCFPRPDSPPAFGRLLDPDGGHFSIVSPLSSSAEPTTSQSYLANTNILLTTVTLANGDAFQITDFCPDSSSTGACTVLRLFRVVEPLQGTPAIQVSCRPISGWDKTVLPRPSVAAII
jgi:GH15 family glucan-1,4-alpha-glucosidase